MADRKLIFNAIRTPDGTVIRSRTTHDYVSHDDKVTGKMYFVDGGLQYQRRSNHGDEVDVSIYSDAPHEVRRHALEWGTYGIKGDQPLTYVPISKMSDDHLAAVIMIDDMQILDKEHSGVKKISEMHIVCMREELERRKNGTYVSRSD